MRKFLIAASLAALTLTPAWAFGQGPVRQGLRATGEAAAQGTRAVVRGTGRVLQGTADATRNVIGGTVDATGRVIGGAVDGTRAVVGGTARGLAAGVSAITPNLPVQARAGATLSDADRAHDARWRFAQHNGEWWYYGPQNSWMYHRDGQWNQFQQDTFAANPAYSGGYATGYRGTEGAIQGDAQYQGQNEGQYASNGRTYQLHHDQQGREYICDNGQRVYFDDGQQGQSYDAGQQQWGADQLGQQGQQNWDANQQGNQPPAIPTEAGVNANAGQPSQTQPSTQGSDMPMTPSQSGGAEGGLAPGSPRDINQNSPATEATQGAPGVGESAQ
jgi:hypothetical protein